MGTARHELHVAVSDVIRSDEKSPWSTSASGTYVDSETLRKFKKLVVDTEYEQNRRRREWLTATGAVVAALGTLLNLYLTLRSRK